MTPPKLTNSADVSADSLQQRARELLDTAGELTRHERQLLLLRYGLGGEEPRTIAQVADKFGLSSHEIEAIEADLLSRASAASKA